MKVGVTGHQNRPGIDWDWVRWSILGRLSRFRGHLVGVSSLAVGADQLFAECILELKGELVAVIPSTSYEKAFNLTQRKRFLWFLQHSSVVQLSYSENSQEAFLMAGRWIVDNSDLMIAVWDEKPSGGKGGTADIVAYLEERHRPVFFINPVNMTTREAGPWR